MGRMTKHNLHNVKCIFEERTNIDLNPAHRSTKHPRKRVLLLAAVLACCALLAAFAIPLFTPLNGDELTLSGTYLGEGVISVTVKNDSDRTLEFQKQLKLFSWTTGQEIPPLGGTVRFENTEFVPHSSGTMTIDLSDAYDVEELETTVPGRPNQVYYYLLLTNQDFLFGHDWMCSFSFGAEETIPETTEAFQTEAPSGAAQSMAAIEEELRFYFEKGYWDEIPAFNEANFTYQQKVQELLLRAGGTLVRPVDPMLLVKRTPSEVVFDDKHPQELQYRLVGQNYHAIDGYNRIVGTEFSGGGSDYSLQLEAILPQKQGETDGGVGIPLIYLFTYETSAVQAEDAYAFIYGQRIPFSELEAYKVYADDQYVVYNATNFFYTDLDAYLDYFLTTRDDIYCDDQIRQRVRSIYEYHMDPENLTFYYNLPQ